MSVYISLLRGINVSGHKVIKMDALRKMFENLDCKNVQTYIQSGNIIFEKPGIEQKKLEKEIAAKILKEFGFEVPVMVKELEEFKKTVKANPFSKDKTKDTSFFHITFLSSEPDKELFTTLGAGKYAKDEFRLVAKTIYLYCPDGYGNTKLTNNFFENKLKVTATTRNWKTVNELVTMAEKK